MRTIDNEALFDMEQAACASDDRFALMASKLISEVRSLQHQLDDPNYLYVGRIHRQGIITRNAKIDALLSRVTELESQLKSFQEKAGDTT